MNPYHYTFQRGTRVRKNGQHCRRVPGKLARYRYTVRANAFMNDKPWGYLARAMNVMPEWWA